MSKTHIPIYDFTSDDSETFQYQVTWADFPDRERYAGFQGHISLTVDGGERLRGGQFNFIASMMPRPKLKSLFQKVREASRK